MENPSNIIVQPVVPRKTSLEVTTYSEHQFLHEAFYDPDQINQTINNDSVTWIRVVGLAQADIITSICKTFHVHPLAIEDILHTQQRAKVDDYQDFLFVVLRVFDVDTKIESRQISFVLRNNFLLSFEEESTPGFQHVIEKLRNGQGNICKKGEDYLLYALLDTIIDDYYVVEDYLGKKITYLEDEISVDPKKHHFATILGLKREIISMRKNITPVRELIGNLLRIDVTFFGKENKHYLRDLNDHVLRAIESIEAFSALADNLMDIYHSQVNNKMNEVMKTLTVTSAIFIPLTFIVGVYGMNFDYMPELHSRYGYISIWLLMITVAVSLIFYFRYKKYL